VVAVSLKGAAIDLALSAVNCQMTVMTGSSRAN
jgi:hypothetical protein